MTSKKEERYTFQGTGLTTKEKHWAEGRFEEYRSHYSMENFSDLTILEELVYREALQERIKKKIDKLIKSLKKKTQKDSRIPNTEYIPKHFRQALDENSNQMMTIRDKLGLFENKQGESPLKHILELEEKFKIWKEKNWDERKITCPFCSEIIFLNIRTKKYEANKSPFFKGKVLANEPLFRLYEERKISKEDVANVLGVSPDYILWLEKKFFSKNLD